MKIYTRTGDKGMTSLFSGERVQKDNPFIDAVGTVDEGNSALGLALSFLQREERFSSIFNQIEIIQHALFDVGAALATPRTCEQNHKLDKTRFDDEAIALLEKWIDSMDDRLPPLTTFILPGGHPTGAALHLARSIIRRAERLVVPLYEQAEVTQGVLAYLNRLSDYLFILSRFINHQLNVPETTWQHHKSVT
ncbi:MAG: cob(I)yrinic acid a,c-diamide adenosyltransferase [Parachlamydiaceae bacterium]